MLSLLVVVLPIVRSGHGRDRARSIRRGYGRRDYARTIRPGIDGAHDARTRRAWRDAERVVHARRPWSVLRLTPTIVIHDNRWSHGVAWLVDVARQPRTRSTDGIRSTRTIGRPVVVVQ